MTIFNTIDTDRSGSISEQEFINWFVTNHVVLGKKKDKKDKKKK